MATRIELLHVAMITGWMRTPAERSRSALPGLSLHNILARALGRYADLRSVRAPASATAGSPSSPCIHSLSGTRASLAASRAFLACGDSDVTVTFVI